MSRTTRDPLPDEESSGHRVAMLVRNPITQDSRVLKEARTLIDAGYVVRVFGLANQEFPSGNSEVAGIPVTRVYADLGKDRFRLSSALITMLVILVEQFRSPRLPKTTFNDEESPGTNVEFHPLAHESGGSTELRIAHDDSTEVSRDLARPEFVKSPKAPTKQLGVLAKVANVAVRTLRRGFRKILSRTLSSLRPVGIAHLGRSFSLAVVPYVEQWSPHIIHCHDAECGLAALRLNEDPFTQIVYDSHELWLERNTPAHMGALGRLVRRWEGRVEERLVRNSTLVITVNPGIAREIERKYKRSKGSVIAIRNIPLAVPHPSSPIDLREFRQFPDETLVVYSGRITNHRLLHELIEAVSQLGQYQVAVVLVGYGSKKYVEDVRRDALHLGVRLIVIGPVPVDSVIQTLSTADVIFVGVEPIVKSYLLALPNKFFEALMSSRPVVYPALPEMLEIATNMDATYPFNVLDASSLKVQLREALEACKIHPCTHDRNLGWESEADFLLRNYWRICRKTGCE